LVVKHLCLKLYALTVDVQEPQWWVTGVLGQAGYLSRIRGMGSDTELARATESRVAKTVERRVLALVLIILFASLFDDELDLIVGQRGSNILEVVFDHLVFPATRVGTFKIDPNVE
jgi:hypothetical protein